MRPGRAPHQYCRCYFSVSWLCPHFWCPAGSRKIHRSYEVEPRCIPALRTTSACRHREALAAREIRYRRRSAHRPANGARELHRRHRRRRRHPLRLIPAQVVSDLVFPTESIVTSQVRVPVHRAGFVANKATRHPNARAAAGVPIIPPRRAKTASG